MKKKITLLALTAIVMAGCAERNDDGSIHAPKSNGTGLSLVCNITIDSCEYIVSGNKMAHKGNCRFCTERRKQELKEIIDAIHGSTE